MFERFFPISLLVTGAILLVLYLVYTFHKRKRAWTWTQKKIARTKKVYKIVTLSILGAFVAASGSLYVIDHVEYAQRLAQATQLVQQQTYKLQNEAFGVNPKYDRGAYQPFSTVDQSYLQLCLCYYEYDTGKAVAISDVETFMGSSKNPDGTARAYDNTPGIVSDYVAWYGTKQMSVYQRALDAKLPAYKKIHPDCTAADVLDLTPAQIIELSNIAI